MYVQCTLYIYNISRINSTVVGTYINKYMRVFICRENIDSKVIGVLKRPLNVKKRDVKSQSESARA